MNKAIKSKYLDLRKNYVQASHALADARSIVHFKQLEDMGLVKFEFEHEIDNYFDVCGRECFSKAEDRRIEKAIELNGLWVGVSYFWNPISGDWELADSIGMLIGQDAHCYEGGVKQNAIDALRKANTEYLKEWQKAS